MNEVINKMAKHVREKCKKKKTADGDPDITIPLYVKSKEV